MKDEDSAFGIILMTPDDFGFAKNEGETEKKLEPDKM